MTCENMREHILKAYPGERWRNRVAYMEDRQVVAIYKNLQRRDKLCGKRRKMKVIEQGQQMTIWDFM